MIAETKKCTKCGEDKTLDAFPLRKDRPCGRQARCKECQKKYNRAHMSEYKAWCNTNRDHLNERTRAYNHRVGRCLPMEESTDSGLYLGVHIAETALTGIFESAVRMPFGTIGYDLLCEGIKIDVKCSAIITRTFKGKYTYDAWRFRIGHNKIADVFAFIAIDDRESLMPLHVWLVPGNWVNNLEGVVITNSPNVLQKWARFEVFIDDLSKKLEKAKRCNA